jgi:hypothetical protein
MSAYPERFDECNCHANARRMVELHPELRYVEGWLVFPRPEPFEPFKLDHAWNVAPDGTIADPTAWPYHPPFSYEAAPQP